MLSDGLTVFLRVAAAAFAASSLVIVRTTAQAQVVAQPLQEKGRLLAQSQCNGCHLVDDASPTPVPVGVPTFRAIANRPGQTGQRIKDVLIQPHTPMPIIQLSNDEITSIMAYLESLRTNDAVPPLITPGGTKPKYPTPS